MLETGRECRYSGARIGIGGTRWHWEGSQGVLRPLWDSSRGHQGVYGVSAVYWELAGTAGTQRLEVYRATRGYWGFLRSVGGVRSCNRVSGGVRSC